MRRLLVLLLACAALGAAIMGVHAAAPFNPARAEAAARAGFCPPTSVLGTPPVGAQLGLGAWWADAFYEAWSDAAAFVLAEIVLLAALVQLAAADEQRRVRTAVIPFLVYTAL